MKDTNLEKTYNWSKKLMTEDFYTNLENIIKNINDVEENSLFAHFICNILPAKIMYEISDKRFENVLDFNHFSNRLIMRFENERER